MNKLLESVYQLKPPAQVAVVIGLLVLLVIVALNPPAGGVIIGFLAGVSSLFNQGCETTKDK